MITIGAADATTLDNNNQSTYSTDNPKVNLLKFQPIRGGDGVELKFFIEVEKKMGRKMWCVVYYVPFRVYEYV